MSTEMREYLRNEAAYLEEAGLMRQEVVVEAPPGTMITLGKRPLLNLCSTDYLGLSTNPEVKRAAMAALDYFGLGPGASRLLAGTLPLHVQLEKALTQFLGTEDTLVFPSGYHAATGVFEALLNDKDQLFCDEQLQVGVADGVRLSRARVFQYRSRDVHDLEDRLRRSRAARFRVIVTDGVFPLEGSTALLSAICSLAQKYDAMVVVEDSHGIGVLGPGGRGTAAQYGVTTDLGLIIGGFAQTLGGGEGGFVSGASEVVTWLRQKSRPHLTANALSPASTAAALKALELAAAGAELRTKLQHNAQLFRDGLTQAGFLLGGATEHPSIPIMLGDAISTQRMADLLFRKGVFAMGFCHPVVPEGAARIRAHVTVKHGEKEIRTAITAFAEAGRELRLLSR
jgi:glycine C-acetyltransferase